MNGIDLVRRMLVLRQTFQLNGRLNLEFQALLSKLLREHGVPVEDDLLKQLILAVTPELMGSSQPGSTKVTNDPLGGPQPPTVKPTPPQASTTTLGPQPPTVLGPQPPTVPGPQVPPAEPESGPPPTSGEVGPQPPA